jgi:hypothetical protein
VGIPVLRHHDPRRMLLPLSSKVQTVRSARKDAVLATVSNRNATEFLLVRIYRDFPVFAVSKINGSV